MRRPCFILIVFIASATAVHSFEPPEDSRLLVEEDFSSAGLPERWTVQNGRWQTENGSLTGMELEADHHAASARRVLETTNAVYQFKFRLSEGTEGFHFGFDPARGELDKKGHLFSVIFTPRDWRIIKHVDKNRPKEDPNEILTLAKQEFAPGQWFELRVTTRDDTVKAEIKGMDPLEAEHPTFDVRKPTLVFRVSGANVALDDLHVWALNE